MLMGFALLGDPYSIYACLKIRRPPGRELGWMMGPEPIASGWAGLGCRDELSRTTVRGIFRWRELSEVPSWKED